MSEKTAQDVVEFIASNCNGLPIQIRWFGGEPTVAAHRIDQISKGLKDKGIRYSFTLTSNGYLLDENMIKRAKDLWNLKDVMISVDGTEANYNSTKAYINPQFNPYQRVMDNIGHLLESKIAVSLRMNFDQDNYRDFEDLLAEAGERYRSNPYLAVHVHQINRDYKDADTAKCVQRAPACTIPRIVGAPFHDAAVLHR